MNTFHPKLEKIDNTPSNPIYQQGYLTGYWKGQLVERIKWFLLLVFIIIVTILSKNI